jgi:DNA-binding winged helix-turn-helix (wHTH) protein
MVSISKLAIVALAIMDPAYNDCEVKPTELRNPAGETLTERESELLAWIIEGFRNKNMLPKISPETVSSRGVHGALKFGPFELSGRKRVLRRDGISLPLGGRAFDILLYLAERPGEVIEKTELMDHVWPDVTVDEGSLRVHVAAIRMALRDGQFGNRYIANVKGRGYAFIGSIDRLEDRA